MKVVAGVHESSAQPRPGALLNTPAIVTEFGDEVPPARRRLVVLEPGGVVEEHSDVGTVGRRHWVQS